jgi:hypothetical protein
MGYDIRRIDRDGSLNTSESSIWYSPLREMAAFRSAMIALGMLVPPTELPADFDDGHATDIGTPGIPSFKLKFTTAHRVSAREIEAALGTHDATPDALAIARPHLLAPSPEPGGGPLDVHAFVAGTFGLPGEPTQADWGPWFLRWLAWIGYLRIASAGGGIEVG